MGVSGLFHGGYQGCFHCNVTVVPWGGDVRVVL